MSAAIDHLPPGERFDATAGDAPNLSAAWLRAWRADPDRPQIHDPRRGWIRRGELEADTARRAGRLARLGLVAGDRVILAAASSADLVASHVACLRMGLVVVPTNTAYGPRELEHVVRDATPRAAIVDDPARRAHLAAIDPALACLDPALDLPDGPTPPLERADRRSVALLCYTSGTTGRPKGAVLRHGHCLASAEGLRLAWRWSERDRLLLALPLFHMHGLGVGLHGTLHTGGSAVLFETFRADEILAAIEPFAATLFFGVPTMYHRLADHPEVARLAALRLCVSGSAPLPADLHAALRRASGQQILERYGMTETLDFRCPASSFGSRAIGARSRSGGRTSSTATGNVPRPTPRPSRRTDSSAPAISAASTPTATSPSMDGRRSSSSAAATTSTPASSRT
jgi:malonyl-CoA/methylmalonyl-CoA synthetase